MSKKWHKGPPPSLGWWPASVFKDKNAIRWWGGQLWSLDAEPSFTKLQAAKIANKPLQGGWQADVEWQHRPKSWPARSFT